jgi:hypothetical protein
VAELGIKVTNVAPGGLRTSFSTGSKAVVASKIADYDGLARDAERIMADHAGPSRATRPRPPRPSCASPTNPPRPCTCCWARTP